VCVLSDHVGAAQGPKVPPGGTTGKKWNHGAPPSKKAKVKSGNGQENAGQEHAAAEQRDPKKTLSTVPLPSSIADVVDAGMARFLRDGLLSSIRYPTSRHPAAQQ